MAFKFNISHKGRTLKLETESEDVVGKVIGETINGKHISADLDGYELKITGTSDISGFPGKHGLEGAGYHRELLKKGFGMKDSRKGLRLRKTLRGQEISLQTSQINTTVVKEGKKKFEDLLPKKEKPEEKEEKKEEKAEVKTEKKPSKAKPEEAKTERKEETKKEEKSAQTTIQ